jgi:ArsR family transcriptional regulator
MNKSEIALRFDREKLEQATYLLKAVVQPTRIAIIDILDQYKEMNVGELAEILEVANVLVSHHLNDMRSKGILNARREGRKIYYSIKEYAVLDLLKCIDNCKRN